MHQPYRDWLDPQAPLHLPQASRLWGPSHGGETAVHHAGEIGSVDNIPSVRRAKDKDDPFRIAGTVTGFVTTTLALSCNRPVMR